MKVEKAVNWLKNHYVIVLGVTTTGVCVMDESVRLEKNGEFTRVLQPIWLPAELEQLRNWMNY